jgi:hypothetical protein
MAAPVSSPKSQAPLFAKDTFQASPQKTGVALNPSTAPTLYELDGASRTGRRTVDGLKAELQSVYGVEVAGEWTAEELETVPQTFRRMDMTLRRLDDNPHTPRGEMFRHFFGDVVIERVDAAEIRDGVFAENVYDEGTGTTTLRFADNALQESAEGQLLADSSLTSEQLIAHELSHTLNNRFAAPNGVPLTQYFNDSIPTRRGYDEHSNNTTGLGFRASTDSQAWYEGLADVTANYLLGDMTSDNTGQIRRQNAEDFLRMIVTLDPIAPSH